MKAIKKKAAIFCALLAAVLGIGFTAAVPAKTSRAAGEERYVMNVYISLSSHEALGYRILWDDLASNYLYVNMWTVEVQTAQGFFSFDIRPVMVWLEDQYRYGQSYVNYFFRTVSFSKYVSPAEYALLASGLQYIQFKCGPYTAFHYNPDTGDNFDPVFTPESMFLEYYQDSATNVERYYTLALQTKGLRAYAHSRYALEDFSGAGVRYDFTFQDISNPVTFSSGVDVKVTTSRNWVNTLQHYVIEFTSDVYLPLTADEYRMYNEGFMMQYGVGIRVNGIELCSKASKKTVSDPEFAIPYWFSATGSSPQEVQEDSNDDGYDDQKGIGKFFNSVGGFFGGIGGWFRNAVQGVGNFFSSAGGIVTIIAVILLVAFIVFVVFKFRDKS